MNNKILTSMLLVATAANCPAFAASVNGLWTGQSFQLKSSGVIKKGQAIDNASTIPKQVNAADIKVKFNCYLQIGQYDDVALKYDFVTTCQGKNGWEITHWGLASDTNKSTFYELVDHQLANSHYSDSLMLGLTTTNGSAWEGDNHWGGSGTYVYFSGQYIFMPKLVNNTIKSATFMNPSTGIIGYESWTLNSDMSGIYKSNMSAKYATGKVEAGAASCLLDFVNKQGNGEIKYPCDPID